jgi:membrane protease YdiL (CAAX protease family)
MNIKISIYYTIGLLLILFLASYLFSIVSGYNKVIALIAAYVTLISFAMLVNLNWDSLGLSKDNISKGLTFAIPFITIIVISAIAIFLINPEIFKDERYNQTHTFILYTVLFTLPIFTVLLEELAFRGVLFGVLHTLVSQNIAVLISSLSFGIWHVFSAGAISTSALPDSVPKIAIVVVIILATTLAGVFLTWTRIKSGSLVAPILIHWTINSMGILLSYLAWQKN